MTPDAITRLFKEAYDTFPRSKGNVSVMKALPPLEIPVWAPLDDQAPGFVVAGRREARVVAMIRKCLKGW